MTIEHLGETDPRIQSALSELQGMIQKRWLTASFSISRGEDPKGIYLDATVDLDDPDEVMDLVVDRLLELQVDEALPVHVIPLRTRERLAALWEQQRRRKPTMPPSIRAFPPVTS
jgi:hypothetical protein